MSSRYPASDLGLSVLQWLTEEMRKEAEPKPPEKPKWVPRPRILWKQQVTTTSVTLLAMVVPVFLMVLKNA